MGLFHQNLKDAGKRAKHICKELRKDLDLIDSGMEYAGQPGDRFNFPDISIRKFKSNSNELMKIVKKISKHNYP